jgi:tetratricopeptide (TPR) repeat protein/predicted Ser/Thr protein kinase
MSFLFRSNAMTGFDTLDNQNTLDEGDQVGKLLAGRYRVVHKLGEGGMGMVYLAEDTELGDNEVAVKFIPPMLAGNKRAVKNLKKEARTSMQLSHPNIVRLHDLHTDGHQKFLVMEYIKGKTLEDMLAEKEDDRLTMNDCWPIAEQIAAGLDYAHSENVLHRDLKPSNIMITPEGKAKLLDFGIAREMRDSYTRVTGHETSGTLPYMSPQQLLGHNPSKSMDVYSLAAVIYECLSGHPPFYQGDIRRQIEVREPDPIEGIDGQVNKALLAALSKGEEKRPDTAGELLAVLQAQEELGPEGRGQKADERREAKVVGPSTNEAQRHKGPKMKLLGVLVVLVLAIGMGAVGWWYWSVERPRRAALAQMRVERGERIAAILSGARKLRQEGRLDEALEEVDDAVKLGSGQAEALALRRDIEALIETRDAEAQQVQNLYDSARAAQKGQQWPQAIAGYQKVLTLDANHVSAKEHVAQCQHDEELQKAEAAKVQADFTAAVAHYTKALIYKKIPSTQEKLAVVKRMMVLQDNRIIPGGKLTQVENQWRSGDKKQAVLTLQNVLKDIPQDAEALQLKAQYLNAMSHAARARVRSYALCIYRDVVIGKDYVRMDNRKIDHEETGRGELVTKPHPQHPGQQVQFIQLSVRSGTPFYLGFASTEKDLKEMYAVIECLGDELNSFSHARGLFELGLYPFLSHDEAIEVLRKTLPLTSDVSVRNIKVTGALQWNTVTGQGSTSHFFALSSYRARLAVQVSGSGCFAVVIKPKQGAEDAYSFEFREKDEAEKVRCALEYLRDFGAWKG